MSHPSALATAPSAGQPKLLLCLSCAFPSPHSVHHEGSASSDAKWGVFKQDCSTDGDDFAQYRSASSGLPSKSFLYKMNHMKGCNPGQVLTTTPDPQWVARMGKWGKEDGRCRGMCKDLGFIHTSEKHLSVPEHSGGKVLHSGMHKTIIHKVTLPAAIINHHGIPLTAPKSTLAQPGKCPGPLQTTQQAG